ncbi:MAG: hypothetical protein JNL11_06770 [Bdellovibrionaceae bacterium]|nr:hypothetical protein [Pseudobdellovibrionaceae bacterium]
MKKILFVFAIGAFLLTACNKANNTTSVAAPPAPTNQCVTPNTVNNAYNTYGVYNPYGTYNAYNPYGVYNTATATGTCNPQLYNQYSAYGFSAYPYTNFYAYNWGNGYSQVPLCDCPANSRPVYNSTIGMGCVSIQYFQPISTGVYYWSLTPNNYQWVNWSQVSNTTGTIGNFNNCYQQIAQSCFTDVANACGSGFVCQATAGGSRLGICRQQ